MYEHNDILLTLHRPHLAHTIRLFNIAMKHPLSARVHTFARYASTMRLMMTALASVSMRRNPPNKSQVSEEEGWWWPLEFLERRERHERFFVH